MSFFLALGLVLVGFVVGYFHGWTNALNAVLKERRERLEEWVQ